MHYQKPVIGIKGRIQTGSYENDDKGKVYFTEVVAERVTFLSSSKSKEDNIEEKKSSKKKKTDKTD